MNPEEEFQRYASLIEYYKQQLSSIETQFSYVQSSIMEYSQAKITIEKIKETKTGTEILIPIGGGTFSFAAVKNPSKILTDVGAGIIIEKTPSESIEVLEKRIENLQKNQESLSSYSQQIQKEMEEVSNKAQQILANAQK
jgi:prefoldin alpha subunit